MYYISSRRHRRILIVHNFNLYISHPLIRYNREENGMSWVNSPPEAPQGRDGTDEVMSLLALKKISAFTGIGHGRWCPRCHCCVFVHVRLISQVTAVFFLTRLLLLELSYGFVQPTMVVYSRIRTRLDTKRRSERRTYHQRLPSRGRGRFCV